MTDEIRIDLSDPDVLTVFNRYAQTITEAAQEFERAKADALKIMKRELAIIDSENLKSIGQWQSAPMERRSCRSSRFPQYSRKVSQDD